MREAWRGWAFGVFRAIGLMSGTSLDLAVRTLNDLPITFPQTTGAPKPLTGGVVARA